LNSLDDAFLLRFLRCEKFRVADAAVRVENFFDVQRQWPELYSNFTFENIKGPIEDGMMKIMKHTDNTGCAIFVFEMKNWNLSFEFKTGYFVFATIFFVIFSLLEPEF